ncbi:MAG: hypothetical protein KAU62_02250 [Candidatus Heimdallarchaeota archaeon]|nr:hypothetical protein [Candidatus Heimdallarchaeota archaeon]MCK4609956.1 hypothetical protein [Candidatus Heimdallarchaeota archaeon]
MIEIMGYLTVFFVMWMVIIIEETHPAEMSRKMKKRYGLGLYDNKKY